MTVNVGGADPEPDSIAQMACVGRAQFLPDHSFWIQISNKPFSLGGARGHAAWNAKATG